MPTLEDISLRKQFRRKLKLDYRTAVLGDNNTPSRVRVPGRSDYVYVRYPASGNNTSNLSWPTIVKMTVNITEAPGTPVTIGYDDEGEYAVKGISTKGVEANGGSGGNAVQNNPLNDWVDISLSPLLRSQPMGVNAPLFVSVLPYSYIDVDKVYHEFNGVSGGVDLEPSIPATPNEWCLAGLFLLQADDTVEIVVSTPKDFAIPLDSTDIQECITGSTDLSLFIACWILRYGQTSIADTDKFIDGRQWINVPQASGSGGTTTFTDDEIREMIWVGMV